MAVRDLHAFDRVPPMNRIGDYALIGDCCSAALVGKDGSVDWACFPRFDSPSVFARILDDERGGHCSVAPSGSHETRREYLADTNVLCTTFTTREGTLEVTDCMPVEPAPDAPGRPRGHASILRRVRCTAGQVVARVRVAPRFDYGSFLPSFRHTSVRTVEIVGGADALWVTTTQPLEVRPEVLEGLWWLREGEEAWLEIAWTDSFVERTPTDHPDDGELARRLEATLAFWRRWIGRCRYRGDHAAAVRRSALVLKLLTYEPTGAVVAAPTTSLPEELGGVRNWDYRYTWIRDSTLTLISLLVLGYRDDADAFRHWLRRTSAGRPRDLQIMYGILGQRTLPELELGHLRGHRDSAPVRIGNGAVKQLQLDVYGSMLQAAYLYVAVGGTVAAYDWHFLRGLTDIVCDRWRDPDQGIWEVRDEPRHFIHSKLLCWVALDRAVKIARKLDLSAPLERWTGERDALQAYLVDEGAAAGWFPQAVGRSEADAATLLVPAMGLFPPRHPAVRETIARVRAELEHDGLVHRYASADGLEGGEGAFLLCSFWLLDALIHAGELEEAERLLDRLLLLANDVGLYAEEVDPATGEHLGNFPQAFTHMALISSCAHLTAAKRGLLPAGDEAYDFAESALHTLLRHQPEENPA